MEWNSSSMRASIAHEIQTHECGICFDVGKGLGLLPCNHKFCATCLLLWSNRCNLCPICRKAYNFMRLFHKNPGMGSQLVKITTSGTVKGKPSTQVITPAMARKIQPILRVILVILIIYECYLLMPHFCRFGQRLLFTSRFRCPFDSCFPVLMNEDSPHYHWLEYLVGNYCPN